MKFHVRYNYEHINVNETFSGGTAEEVVGAMKARVLKELPFPLRLAASVMNNVAFAQEVVRRYNQAFNLNLPLPTSCEEFLKTAEAQGIVTPAGD